jgi:hypothetical protein
MERDGVRGVGPRQFGQARRIEHEQEGAVLDDIDHDGKQNAVVLALGGGGWDEHRLAGIEARLVPGSDRPGFRVDLDDGIEEIAFDLDAGGPNVAIGLAGASRVIDARHLKRRVGQDLSRDGHPVGQRNPKANEPAGGGDRRVGAEPRKVKLIDDRSVGIFDHIDRKAAVIVEALT